MAKWTGVNNFCVVKESLKLREQVEASPLKQLYNNLFYYKMLPSFIIFLLSLPLFSHTTTLILL